MCKNIWWGSAQKCYRFVKIHIIQHIFNLCVPYISDLKELIVEINDGQKKNDKLKIEKYFPWGYSV